MVFDFYGCRYLEDKSMKHIQKFGFILFAAASVWIFADDSARGAPSGVRPIAAESDTGVVFGEPNCKIKSHSPGAVRLNADPFDYLSARVEIVLNCVGANGRVFERKGRDTVIFPSLDFDWDSQKWMVGKVAIGLRTRNLDIIVDPHVEFSVWTSQDDNHVAFKVQIREREKEKDKDKARSAR